MLSEGQTLDGTYRLIRRVAEGGMGVVFEATHARLAGRYAIKVLTERLAESPEAVAYFDREAWITSLLQHPNVVQVLDHNTAPDGTEYLVMEYLAGENLSQRLSREGRLPLDTVVGIVDQIAAGLSAAHARGIVHRDLKPDNVVLVPVEGRKTDLVKILDFGISKPRGTVEAPGVLVCGTPQYMAPEQVEGRPEDVDAATDQFALAVMTQEMLTGRNPFLADSLATTFARVSSDPPMSVGFGPELDAVLARALAKSTARRFRSVTDFSEAFRAAALASAGHGQRLALVSRTESKSPEVERKRRVRPRTWSVAGGAIVAMSVATFLLAAGSAPHLIAAARARTSTPAPTPRPLPGEPAIGSAPRSTERNPNPPPGEPIERPQVGMPLGMNPPPSRGDGSRSVAPARKKRPRIQAAVSRAPARRPPALPMDEDATMPLTEASDDVAPSR